LATCARKKDKKNSDEGMKKSVQNQTEEFFVGV
jgi:hypothetical protein